MSFNGLCSVLLTDTSTQPELNAFGQRPLSCLLCKARRPFGTGAAVTPKAQTPPQLLPALSFGALGPHLKLHKLLLRKLMLLQLSLLKLPLQHLKQRGDCCLLPG